MPFKKKELSQPLAEPETPDTPPAPAPTAAHTTDYARLLQETRAPDWQDRANAYNGGAHAGGGAANGGARGAGGVIPSGGMPLVGEPGPEVAFLPVPVPVAVSGADLRCPNPECREVVLHTDASGARWLHVFERSILRPHLLSSDELPLDWHCQKCGQLTTIEA